MGTDVDTRRSLHGLGRDESEKTLRKMGMPCMGYIHEGPEPPEECPVCGAPKDLFDPKE